MTTRRTVVRGLGAGALLVGVRHAWGQPQARIPRIGMLVLGLAEDAYSKRAIAVFRQRLAELGYVEGKTVLIDARYAEGSTQRLTELARELAGSKVDFRANTGPAPAGLLSSRSVWPVNRSAYSVVLIADLARRPILWKNVFFRRDWN